MKAACAREQTLGSPQRPRKEANDSGRDPRGLRPQLARDEDPHRIEARLPADAATRRDVEMSEEFLRVELDPGAEGDGDDVVRLVLLPLGRVLDLLDVRPPGDDSLCEQESRGELEVA